MSRRSSASPASAPTHGARAQARPASSTPTESPRRRQTEPPQSNFSPGTADTGRSRSTTTSGTSSSTRTPASHAQASRPRTTRCAPTSPSRSSSTRPTSTVSHRQHGTSRYSARTPSPRSSLPERRNAGLPRPRTKRGRSLGQRQDASADVGSAERNLPPEPQVLSSRAAGVEARNTCRVGGRRTPNNPSAPSADGIRPNSAAWDSPGGQGGNRGRGRRLRGGGFAAPPPARGDPMGGDAARRRRLRCPRCLGDRSCRIAGALWLLAAAGALRCAASGAPRPPCGGRNRRRWR